MTEVPVRIPIPRAPVCVVVADASRARVFTALSGRSALNETETLIEPRARMKGQELVSDDTGRTFDRAGTGRHGKEPVTDPKDVVEAEFARELADHLRHAAQDGVFEKLYLVAPPSFLGELRAALPEAVRKLVVSELGKDLTRHTPQQIREALPEFL